MQLLAVKVIQFNNIEIRSKHQVHCLWDSIDRVRWGICWTYLWLDNQHIPVALRRCSRCQRARDIQPGHFASHRNPYGSITSPSTIHTYPRLRRPHNPLTRQTCCYDNSPATLCLSASWITMIRHELKLEQLMWIWVQERWLWTSNWLEVFVDSAFARVYDFFRFLILIDNLLLDQILNI